MDEAVYEQLYDLEDRHWWFRGRRSVIAALLQETDLPAAPRVLDAGCGTGRNLLDMLELGPAVGVDMSAAAVDFCLRRGAPDVRQATLDALPFDAGSFDLLVAFDVIEHIEDDVEALRELRRVAEPGAALLVTVPAYRWMWSQHDDTHHHRRRYTRRRLVAALAAGGWEPERVTHFNSLLLTPIVAARAVGRLKRGAHTRSDYDLSSERLNDWLELPLRAEALAIGRGLDMPAGVSIAAVCRVAPSSATR